MSRVLLPALLAVLLVAAGCSDDEHPTASGPPTQREHTHEHAKTEPSPAATSRPSAAPSGSQGHTRGGPHAAQHPAQHPGRHKIAPLGGPVARPDGAWEHLLAADRMPAPGGTVAWTVAGTSPEDGEPTGACQKTSLVDLGAMRAVRRDYAGAEDSTFRARQVVARFADPRSAWRASEVLASWREDCAKRLDYPRSDVGAMEEVATEPGAAGRYPLSYGTRRDLQAAELGIVRTGRWLTVIEIAADSEAYPADHHPARRAVRKIAATFG